MERRNEKTQADQAVSADSAAVTAKKLPWERPEFTSIQPLSETHGLPGGSVDGGANQS